MFRSAEGGAGGAGNQWWEVGGAAVLGVVSGSDFWVDGRPDPELAGGSELQGIGGSDRREVRRPDRDGAGAPAADVIWPPDKGRGGSAKRRWGRGHCRFTLERPAATVVRETSPHYRTDPKVSSTDLKTPAPPDPFADLDTLLELEDEIRSLSVQIHAATHRLLMLIAEFDRRRGWEVGGHRSCADWLSYRTGIDRGAARERVRAARALEELPETSAAMSRGELSFSQIRALTRVATAGNEEELLEFARDNSASRLERLVRGWKSRSAESETARDERLHRSRHLSVFPDEDGMYVVKGVIPAELGALLMRAIEAASDVLFREEGRRTPIELDPEGSRAAASRRRADALGLLAERALAAGFTAEEGAPVSGTRPERYQVVLHVEEQTLQSGGGVKGRTEGPGRTSRRPHVSAETRKGESATANSAAVPDPNPRSHLEDGTRVSPETSRRLCCDAAVVRVREAPEGSVLSVGRRSRTIPPALRRALDIRDRGCRFPGCESRFTDAHHVQHWADGGETSLTNCLLLCPFHHRLVHEGGWRIHWLGKAQPLFVDPRGQQHFDGGWKPPAPIRDG